MRKLFRKKSIKKSDNTTKPLPLSEGSESVPVVKANNNYTSLVQNAADEESHEDTIRPMFFGKSCELFTYLHATSVYAKTLVNWNDLELLNTIISRKDIIREVELNNELQDANIFRGLRWRNYFNLFSDDCSEWISRVIQRRSDYSEALNRLVLSKCGSYITNFYNENEWDEFYKVSVEAKEIMQDLVRTYSDNEFFDEYRTILCRILLVFANEHQEFKYMQGMNELIAPLFYVIMKDAIYVSENKSKIESLELSSSYPIKSVLSDLGATPYDFLSTICSQSSVEADTYSLFCELMKVAGDWFDSQFISDGSYNDIRVVAKCHQILLRLQVKDGELSKSLTRIRMNPPLYLVKWIRILFAQIFPLDELLEIWDAIFAHSSDCELIEYICTAILVYIRNQLTVPDITDAMNSLFSFNGAGKSRSIINLALISSLTSSPFFSGYFVSDVSERQQRDFINSAKQLGSKQKEVPKNASSIGLSDSPCYDMKLNYYRKILRDTADSISSITAQIQENEDSSVVLESLINLHKKILNVFAEDDIDSVDIVTTQSVDF